MDALEITLLSSGIGVLVTATLLAVNFFRTTKNFFSADSFLSSKDPFKDMESSLNSFGKGAALHGALSIALALCSCVFLTTLVLFGLQ